jgi:plasmid maintenance system antidote protein VapI
MNTTLGAVDRKPQSTIRKDCASQRAMGFVAVVPPAHCASDEFISKASWAGVLRYAVQRSGMDDYEVAEKIHVSHGLMSRVLKGTAGIWGERLVLFMQTTGSIAPLQWMAEQMGFELRLKERSEKEILQARIAELEAKERDAA